MSVTAAASAIEAAPYASLADQAYHVLRKRLIMLDIPPGAAINEAALAAELGIGRTPVRESLKNLETDHLVVSYPRRGTFATRVDITDLAAISEMRRVLEPLAAQRAAVGATEEQREELRDKARQIRSMSGEDTDNRALMEYDVDVHRLIYRASDNPHLEETLVRLDNLVTRIWCLVLHRMPSVADHIREHVGLLEAIADGDAERASTLAGEHVEHFEASIRAVL
ncbi:GntR family transcriptional regulator [Tersicoccus solisilvae]|uniref:GntR family transcriptional regulator n=1 Tax=Tersicoccus solisilvae TaxID=1882339 RepID=A0ABQ1P9X1_9MICC|nr:GntR family transcriptional regulator [Tersicoccus solisilvae]GGC93544.1 GntR family transcriptional regulator [Tersicoccus solisilvae]